MHPLSVQRTRRPQGRRRDEAGLEARRAVAAPGPHPRRFGAWACRPEALEFVWVRLEGEHLLRRPLEHARAEGLRIEEQERYKRGIVERVSARKPEAEN